MTDAKYGPQTALSVREPISVIIFKILAILGLLYLFLLSITLLGASFKLAGKAAIEGIFSSSGNPIVGLAIGILATAIIQSSSTTTSIVVGLVGTGFVSFDAAIPIVMGANIGTTITNTIVALAHISKSEEFKRALSGSIVHDFFNVCAVAVLLPLQHYFGIIGGSARWVEHLFQGYGGLEFTSPLKTITKPVSNWLINLTGDTAWLAALVALLLLFIALRYIVKLLKSMVLSRVEKFFQRYIFRNPALGFGLGIVLTTLVQSSSITTSLTVPLLGAGVITIAQVFPYMLGANIGTTVTAFLASFVTGSTDAVSVAFAHLFFNIYGTAIFWPLKRIPIGMANGLVSLTVKSRWIPIGYILITFYAVPALIVFAMR